MVEFESDEIRDARKKKTRSITGNSTLNLKNKTSVGCMRMHGCHDDSYVFSPKVQLLSTSKVPSFSSMSVERCQCG